MWGLWSLIEELKSKKINCLQAKFRGRHLHHLNQVKTISYAFHFLRLSPFPDVSGAGESFFGFSKSQDQNIPTIYPDPW